MSYAYPRKFVAIGANQTALNAEVDNTFFADQNKQGLTNLLNPLVGRVQDTKMCLLGNPLTIANIGGSPVRWRYELETVWVPNNASPTVDIGYVFDPQDPLPFYGYNLYEWMHAIQDTTGDGSTTLSSWIADGGSITPVQGIVFAYAVKLNWQTTTPNSGTGDLIWLFDRANGYICPPPKGEGG